MRKIKEYDIISCPFCSEATISVIRFPSAWSEKHSGKNSLGRGVSVHKSKEQLVFQTGCYKCGKSVEEVEKEWSR